MSSSDPQDDTHNIAYLAVAAVVLAIVIITALTISAIVAGPPL